MVTEPLTRNFALSVLFISFFAATFQVSFDIFERQRSTRANIHPVSCFAGSSSKFLTRKDSVLEIVGKFQFNFRVGLDIEVKAPTRLSFIITEITSPWNVINSVDSISVRVTRVTDRSAQTGNTPFIVSSPGIEKYELEFTLDLEGPSDNRDFAYLGSLHSIRILLNVIQEGHDVLKVPLVFKMDDIHQSIQKRFTQELSQICQRPSGDERATSMLLNDLKTYWEAMN